MTEFRNAENSCRTPDLENKMRQCMTNGVSPGCAQRFLAKEMGQADAACKAEIQGKAMPCAQSVGAEGKQCLETKVSRACMDEAHSSFQRTQQNAKNCAEAMQRLCGSAPKEKRMDCLKENESALRTSCKSPG